MANISANEALSRLKEGNARFISEKGGCNALTSVRRRSQLVEGQKPFAVILGCSDSRVPGEIIFDQGLGDLFVIRVAGNIVARSQVGSIEFAVQSFSTPLVVVLGHSSCGAIETTLDVLKRARGKESPNLSYIVDHIRPGVETLLETNPDMDEESIVGHAVRANIRASVNQLRHGSEMLEHMVQKKKLVIVGAEYSLETGLVDFFEGV